MFSKGYDRLIEKPSVRVISRDPREEDEPTLKEPPSPWAVHREETWESDRGRTPQQSTAPLGVSPLVHEWSGARDIVQFSASIYYVREEEGAVDINIMRLGALQGPISFHYCTEDISAIGGVRYESHEGRVLLEDKQSSASINIKILKDEAWANVSEFKVKLKGPLVNCETGLYLDACRVKVTDSEIFPSDKYRKQLMAGKPGTYNIPPMGLIWEYIKLNCYCNAMFWPTIVILIFDQLANLYLFATIKVNVYLVDVVFQNASLGEVNAFTRWELTIAAMLYVLPLSVLHLWDYARGKLAVKGKSRTWLQTNLYAKYLEFSERSISEHSPGHVHGSVITDAANIAEGYNMLVGLLQKIGKIIILSCFMIGKDVSGRIVAGLAPVCIWIFACLMDSRLERAAEAKDDRLDEVEELVDETVSKFELIVDYYKRPEMTALFKNRIAGYNEACGREARCLIHCSNFTRWLAAVVAGCFIVLKGPDVILGKLSLGLFVALVRVFQVVIHEYGVVFVEVLAAKRLMLIGLRDVATYMNEETNLPQLHQVSIERRAATKAGREWALARAGGNTFRGLPIDHLPFEFRDVSFSHSSTKPPILRNVSLAVHQGSLVCISGEHCIGRATLMRLLAHKIFPTSGSIFIPAHYRILHVSEHSYIFNLSVWPNLCFGHSKVCPQLVMRVLEELDLTRIKRYVEHDLEMEREHLHSASEVSFAPDTLYPDQDGCHWYTCLSESERCRIHLARAFIMNPEVLVLQRPFKHFDEQMGWKIMRLLRCDTFNRGIGMPVEEAGRRRPKTVFFNAENKKQEQEADVIWTLDGHGSIQSTPGCPSGLHETASL